MLLAEFGTGQVFLSMLWFFLFFIWIWMLIIVFGDIFRSDDLSGWGKALWTIFIILVPYLGVFVYLIARGHKMQDRSMREAAQQERQFRSYVQDAAGSGGGGRGRRDRSASRPTRSGRAHRGRVPTGQGQSTVVINAGHPDHESPVSAVAVGMGQALSQ